MNSKISIINSALSRMGERKIDDLEDDTSTAILMNQNYDHIRKQMLRVHPWSFVRKRVRLSPVQEQPTFGYMNAFALPSDLVRILNPNVQNWEVEGRYILADTDNLELIYICDNGKEQEFDDLFVECLILQLVAEMCKPITGSSAAGDAAFQKLQEQLRLARAISGQERPAQKIDGGQVSELVWSRF